MMPAKGPLGGVGMKISMREKERRGPSICPGDVSGDGLRKDGGKSGLRDPGLQFTSPRVLTRQIPLLFSL